MARPMAVEPVAETKRHVRARNQGFADLAASDDDGRQVIGRAAALRPEALNGPLEQRLRGERGQRRLLRGLPHARIAAHKRQRRVPCPDRDREIERGDDAGDAQRMPGLHHAMVRPLGGDGQPVELPGEADGEIADVDHLLDLAQALGQDLAGLQRDQLAERRLVRAQLQAEQAHQFAARRGGHLAPFEERGAGCLHGGVNLAGAGQMRAADDLPGNGRRNLKRPAGVKRFGDAKALKNCPRAGGETLAMFNRRHWLCPFGGGAGASRGAMLSWLPGLKEM